MWLDGEAESVLDLMKEWGMAGHHVVLRYDPERYNHWVASLHLYSDRLPIVLHQAESSSPLGALQACVLAFNQQKVGKVDASD